MRASVFIGWAAWAVLFGGVAQAQTVDFAANVLPILKQKCFKCHQQERVVNGQPEKPKGGLRLDAARAIAMGGDNGAVVIPRKPKESPMFLSVTYPPGDPDIMPPKGDPLTKKQQYIIGKWIHEGARFRGWRGNEAGLPAAPPRIAGSTSRPSSGGGENMFNQGGTGATGLTKAGATVTAVSKGSNDLIVDFASESELVNDEALSGLAEVATRVVDLNLSRTQITDAAMADVAKCTNLERLSLARTGIGDDGLAQLKTMTKLKYLNLYGTKVSDDALASIASMKQLESVYFWQTGVTERGAEKLRGTLPKLKIVFE